MTPEDKVKALELQNESLKNDVALLQKGQPIMRPDVREEKRLNDEIDRLNRLNDELKALLWVARDAVTDHDFPKGHRYDVIAAEIEKAVGSPIRCRWCGKTDHESGNCQGFALKRKCVATVSGIKCEAQADYGDLCAAHRYLDNT